MVPGKFLLQPTQEREDEKVIRSHSCAEGGFLAWPFELAMSDDLKVHFFKKPEFELLLELEHVIFSLKAIIFWCLRGCCSSYTGFIGWFIVSPDFDFKRKWPDKYWKGKRTTKTNPCLCPSEITVFCSVCNSEAPFLPLEPLVVLWPWNATGHHPAGRCMGQEKLKDYSISSAESSFLLSGLWAICWHLFLRIV